MPGELNAEISQGGVNVSGGQRQRLAMARALVRKPEIYLFDDSFSALDLATDARLRAALGPATMLFGNLNFVAIAVLGGIRVANGAMTIGGIQAFIQYSRSFTQPLAWMASMVTMLQSGIASAERVFELLDAEEQSPDVSADESSLPCRRLFRRIDRSRLRRGARGDRGCGARCGPSGPSPRCSERARASASS